MENIDISRFITENYQFLNIKIVKTLETRGLRKGYLFHSGKEKFVFKVFDKDIRAREFKEILTSQNTLNSKGFNGPEIVLSKKNRISEKYKGQLSYIYKYIEGEEARPSREFFYNFGQLIAQLHSLNCKDYKLPKYSVAQDLAKIMSFIETKTNSSQKNKLIIDSASLISSFPKQSDTLIHRDPSFYNTIVHNNKLYLLDYDNLSKGPFYVDLGHIVAYMFFLVPDDYPKLGLEISEKSVIFYQDWFLSFLRGYQSVRKINLDSKMLLGATIFAAIKYIYQDNDPRIYTWNFKRLEEILSEQKNFECLFAKVT